MVIQFEQVEDWSTMKFDGHYEFILCCEFKPEMVEEALKKGYQQNVIDVYGRILIHYVAFSNPLGLICLKHGADVRTKHDNGQTVLHLMIDRIYNWSFDYQRIVYGYMYKLIDLYILLGASITERNKYKQNVIQYTKQKIQKKMNTRCTCFRYRVNHIQMDRCDRCKQWDLLKLVYRILQNYERKGKTLFQLLLPKMRTYKFRSNLNKRQRKN